MFCFQRVHNRLYVITGSLVDALVRKERWWRKTFLNSTLCSDFFCARQRREMRGANTGGPFSANGLSLTDPFFYTLPLPALSLSVSSLPSSGLFYFFGRRPTERHARGLLDEMVASGSVVRNFYFSPAAERAPSRGRPSYHLSLPFPLPLVEEEAFKTGLEGHKKREREGLLRFLFPVLGDRLVFLQLPFFLVLSPFWSLTSSDPLFASFSAREREI